MCNGQPCPACEMNMARARVAMTHFGQFTPAAGVPYATTSGGIDFANPAMVPMMNLTHGPAQGHTALSPIVPPMTFHPGSGRIPGNGDVAFIPPPERCAMPEPRGSALCALFCDSTPLPRIFSTTPVMQVGAPDQKKAIGTWGDLCMEAMFARTSQAAHAAWEDPPTPVAGVYTTAIPLFTYAGDVENAYSSIGVEIQWATTLKDVQAFNASITTTGFYNEAGADANRQVRLQAIGGGGYSTGYLYLLWAVSTPGADEVAIVNIADALGDMVDDVHVNATVSLAVTTAVAATLTDVAFRLLSPGTPAMERFSASILGAKGVFPVVP